jgi:sporulation integral membrane protein YtvI
MLVVFGTVGTVMVLLIIQLVAELIHLSAKLPEITREVRVYVEQVVPDAIKFYGELPPEVVLYLQDAVRNFSRMIQSVVEVAVTSLLSFLSIVPGSVIFIIITILATYFITNDKRTIADYWRKVLPRPYGHKSLLIIKEILNAFWAYLKAQSVLVCITTVLSMIGFYIIGFDYAITLGLMVGLLDLIPVLGPATLIIPWALWFMLNANWVFAIKLLILYAVIFVVRQMLEARVVAANLGLHPLATLLAMYIGLSLIGFIGLIAGPILLIAIKATLTAGKIGPGVK